MTLRQTHTFAELEVSPTTYDEIRQKLEDAGYQHAFVDSAIDMHGIGLTRASGTIPPLGAARLREIEDRIADLDRRLRPHRSAGRCPMTGGEDCCDTLVVELRTLQEAHTIIAALLARLEQFEGEARDLIGAGTMLANVAFNLAQLPERVPDADDRATLSSCRQNWDAVRERQVTSRASTSTTEPTDATD
jgi:hypothetical protein